MKIMYAILSIISFGWVASAMAQPGTVKKDLKLLQKGMATTHSSAEVIWRYKIKE